MEVLEIASLATNAVLLMGFFGWRFLKRKPKTKPEPVISKIAAQLIESIRSDEGWEFVDATKSNGACWINEGLKSGFEDGSNTSAARIYKPFLYYFSKDELIALKQAIQDRNLRVLLDSRSRLLDDSIESQTNTKGPAP